METQSKNYTWYDVLAGLFTMILVIYNMFWGSLIGMSVAFTVVLFMILSYFKK